MMKLNPLRSPYLLGTLILLVTLACRSSTHTRMQRESIPNGGQTTVTVVAQDFEFTLDVEQVVPGTIIFAVRNDGHMLHDFAISGGGVEAKTPMIEPGETATLEVTLETGSYSYVCTVPGHALLGMKGTFTVAP